MQSPPRFHVSETSIRVSDLRRLGNGWVLDGEYRQLSPRTIETRRDLIRKFTWWLSREGCDLCDTTEIRGFLRYLSTSHGDPEGRWGNPRCTRPLSSRSVKDYFINLQTLFRWIMAEGLLDINPMANLKPPIHRPDQVQPFTEAQVSAILNAARRTDHPKRDSALVLFLLDTGVRVSELCNLQVGETDIASKKAVVLGKGNKHRAVYFGRETARALWQYLKPRNAQPDDPLFLSERGTPFSRSGVQQLIERLGEAARIEAVRCSPHVFRHTCAIWFLRSGGQVFALKELLGHTDLAMTSRYVAVAQADVQNQHRQFSPVERLKGKSR